MFVEGLIFPPNEEEDKNAEKAEMIKFHMPYGKYEQQAR